jgi:hypothetical protein
MNPFDPGMVFNVSGGCTMRCVTVALETERVRNLLPNGLELGVQSMTPLGTHPIVFMFQEMFRVHWSTPNLMPSMSYHEHLIGIPYCYAVNSPLWGGNAGPYFFMPTLRLDNALATTIGLLGGLPKRLARINAPTGCFAVLDEDCRPLVTASWEDEDTGDIRPLREFEREFRHFEPVRQALDQPLIVMVPLSIGPWFCLYDFRRWWEEATIRPIRVVTDVHTDYVVGFSPGRYPKDGEAFRIDEDPLGSFELQTQWFMGAPYPPIPQY